MAAKDREALLEWLMTRPLAHCDAERGDLLIHAGLIPQWSAADALKLSADVQAAIRADPRKVFDEMYGNKPECWSGKLRGAERLRFAINVLTRMRVCTAEGCIDMEMKGAPDDARAPFRAWFAHENRRSRDVRVIAGHWSALGYYNAGGVLAIDSGCVWGIEADRVQARRGQEPHQRALRGGHLPTAPCICGVLGVYTLGTSSISTGPVPSLVMGMSIR